MILSNFDRLRLLIKLAEKVGEDKTERFENIVRRLNAKHSEYLFQKTYEELINKDLSPLLDQTFPRPINSEDLKSIAGKYQIGTDGYPLMSQNWM